MRITTDNVSDFITDMVTSRELTTKGIAQHVGVNEATIWRWKHKKMVPNITHFIALCELAGNTLQMKRK
jgi:DNA-binding XRE family transcriptional regulator